MTTWRITADDLGFSPFTNEAILRGAAAGGLTHASLMVNMPFAEEILPRIAAEVPTLGIGLHFTLTSGRPVAPAEEIPLLVDSRSGLFCHGFGGLWFRRRNAEFLRQVRHEFQAQVGRAETLLSAVGLCLTHLDSHQHIHAIPGIFSILAEFAAQRGVWLRIPREHFGSFRRLAYRTPRWFPMGFGKRWILNRCLRGVPQEGTFAGVLDSGHMTTAAWHALHQAFDAKNGTVEVNLHPAIDTDLAPFLGQICCSAADFRFWSSPERVAEFHAILPPER